MPFIDLGELGLSEDNQSNKEKPNEEQASDIALNINVPDNENNQESSTPVATASEPEQEPQPENDNMWGINKVITSVADSLRNVDSGIISGAEKAVNASADFLYSTGKFAYDVATKGLDEASYKDEESPIRIPDAAIPKVEGPAGEIASGISEFVTGFVSLGKFGKMMGLAKQATSKGEFAKYAYDLGRGMLADTLGFKAQTQNLTSEIVEACPSLDGPLAEFIKNDGKSDRMEGRLKNAIEGAGLGLALDGILKLAKWGRALYHNEKNPQALGEEIVKIEKEGEDGAEKTTPNSPNESAIEAPETKTATKETESTQAVEQQQQQKPTEPYEYSTEAVEAKANGRQVVTDPSEERASRLLKDVADGRKRWEDDSLSSQELLDLAHTASLHGEHLDLLTRDSKFTVYAVKSDRFNSVMQSSQEGIDFLKAIHARIADEQLAKATRQTFGDVRRESAQMAKDIGLKNVSNVYDVVMHHANVGKEAIHEAIVARLQLQSIMVGMSKTVRDLAQRIQTGTANYNDYVMFEKAGKRLQAMYKMDRDLGTESGRLLVNRKNTASADEAFKGSNIHTDNNGRVDLFRIFDDMPDTHGRSAMDEWNKGYREVDNPVPSMDKRKPGKKVDGTPDMPREAVEDNTIRTPEGRTEVDLTEYKARMEKAARLVMMCNGDPKRMFGVAKVLGAPTWNQQFNFWFTQQILSGINTHLFQIGGNFIKTGLMASERIAGAAVVDAYNLVKGQSTNEVKYALQYAYDLFRPTELLAAVKFAIKAGQDNASGLVSSRSMNASKFGMEGENARMMMNSNESFEALFKAKEDAGEKIWPWERFVAKIMATTGVVGRGNARFMLAEDELFRQLHFNAAKREMITRRLDEAGVKRGTKEWTEEFKKAEDGYFTSEGLVDVKNMDANEALNLASRSTYSEDADSEVLNYIIKATNICPPLKIAMPFIKTVYNVALDSAEHIPLANTLSRRYREELMGKHGFRLQEEAYGKMALGSGLAFGAYMLVENGMLTGALSKNPKIRDAQMRAGMKPYSIKIGDAWISYQRADPIAACLGAVANYHTVATNNDGLSEQELSDKAGYIIGSFIASIADKSFLSGFHDILDAAFSGQTAGEKLAKTLGGTTASLLPASGLTNQLWKNWLPNLSGDMIGNDDYTERDKGFMGGFKGSSAYYDMASSALANLGFEAAATPKKYDWVTGKPVERSVVYSPSKRDDFVIDELEKEAGAVYGPPLRYIGKIPLNAEQYSRYCELNGTVTINGKTMMQKLEEVMSSPRYDYHRKTFADDQDVEGRTYRGDMLRKVMKHYREEATRKLLEEFPELNEQKTQLRTTERSNRKATPVGLSQGDSLKQSLGGLTEY